LITFQIAKNNRLMVYRQSIKQEIAKEGGASAYGGQSPCDVGSKKLIIKPPSSRVGAEVARRRCDKDVDNNNNDSDKDKMGDRALHCENFVSKKLIIGPSTSHVAAETDRKNCDKDIGIENSDSSKQLTSVDNLKGITGGNIERYSDEARLSTDDESRQAVIDSTETEQTASGSTAWKGQKTGKKSAAGGRKGIDELYSILIVYGLPYLISGVPRWRPHHRQVLATLPSVGANP